jgi:hypothetical protein
MDTLLFDVGCFAFPLLGLVALLVCRRLSDDRCSVSNSEWHAQLNGASGWGKYPTEATPPAVVVAKVPVNVASTTRTRTH